MMKKWFVFLCVVLAALFTYRQDAADGEDCVYPADQSTREIRFDRKVEYMNQNGTRGVEDIKDVPEASRERCLEHDESGYFVGRRTPSVPDLCMYMPVEEQTFGDKVKELRATQMEIKKRREVCRLGRDFVSGLARLEARNRSGIISTIVEEIESIEQEMRDLLIREQRLRQSITGVS